MQQTNVALARGRQSRDPGYRQLLPLLEARSSMNSNLSVGIRPRKSRLVMVLGGRHMEGSGLSTPRIIK